MKSFSKIILLIILSITIPALAQATNSPPLTLFIFVYFQYTLPLFLVLFLILFFKSKQKTYKILFSIVFIYILAGIIILFPNYIQAFYSQFGICDKIKNETTKVSCLRNNIEKYNDSEICENLKKLPAKDLCYYTFAIKNTEFSLCQNMRDLAWSSNSGYREMCYQKTLYPTMDDSYCKEKYKDGDNYLYCLQYLAHYTTNRLFCDYINKDNPCYDDLLQSCLKSTKYDLACRTCKARTNPYTLPQYYLTGISFTECASLVDMDEVIELFSAKK